jgi:hypothetical protein
MRAIARVRTKNNIFDINDNITDDDCLMLFDVMDGRRFVKKTLQSLTKHTFSVKNIPGTCDLVFDNGVNRGVAGLLTGDH